MNRASASFTATTISKPHGAGGASRSRFPVPIRANYRLSTETLGRFRVEMNVALVLLLSRRQALAPLVPFLWVESAYSPIRLPSVSRLLLEPFGLPLEAEVPFPGFDGSALK